MVSISLTVSLMTIQDVVIHGSRQTHPSNNGVQHAVHRRAHRHAHGKRRIDKPNHDAPRLPVSELNHENHRHDDDARSSAAHDDPARHKGREGVRLGGKEAAECEERDAGQDDGARGEDCGEAADEGEEGGGGDEVAGGEPHGEGGGVEVDGEGALDHGEAGHVCCFNV